jgi:threonine synthase
MSWNGVINRFKKFLPVSEKTPVITLKEGNTPLIELKNLPARIGADFQVFVKFEGLNPTCSFKDRGMTLAISKALEEGSRAVICASTGNTSASAAAYAARAGMSCVVLIPEGHIALGKLSQAMLHNAKVIQVQGNFDQALELVKVISEKYPITLVNSLNPYRIEGQKTAAFEVAEALGAPPDYLCIPVGQCRQYHRLLEGFHGDRRPLRHPERARLKIDGPAGSLRFSSCWFCSDSRGPDNHKTRDHCYGHQDRQPRFLENGRSRPRWIRRSHRQSDG